MRRLHKHLVPLLVAGVTAFSGVANLGCQAHARGYVIEDVPPPREEVVIYRPGYIWVQGHWTLAPGRRWVWRGGYYDRERANHLYTQGHWQRQGSKYVWVEGGWRPRARVVVRGR
jgi:hypothetical protein